MHVTVQAKVQRKSVAIRQMCKKRSKEVTLSWLSREKQLHEAAAFKEEWSRLSEKSEVSFVCCDLISGPIVQSVISILKNPRVFGTTTQRDCMEKATKFSFLPSVNLARYSCLLWIYNVSRCLNLYCATGRFDQGCGVARSRMILFGLDEFFIIFYIALTR